MHCTLTPVAAGMRRRGGHIASAQQAHGQALVAGREGAGAEVECHAEAGAGNAQQHTHRQEAAVRVDEAAAGRQGP